MLSPMSVCVAAKLGAFSRDRRSVPSDRNSSTNGIDRCGKRPSTSAIRASLYLGHGSSTAARRCPPHPWTRWPTRVKQQEHARAELPTNQTIYQKAWTREQQSPASRAGNREGGREHLGEGEACKGVRGIGAVAEGIGSVREGQRHCKRHIDRAESGS